MSKLWNPGAGKTDPAASRMKVTFHPSGRGKAQCAPDPAFPRGKAVKVPGAGPKCRATLPYPAPECGHFLIACQDCGHKIAVTAAGRPDDPISAEWPCQRKAQLN